MRKRTIFVITEIFSFAKNVPVMLQQVRCPESVDDSTNVQSHSSVVMVTEHNGKLSAFSNSSAGGTAKLFDGL